MNFNTTWLKSKSQFNSSSKSILLETNFYSVNYYVQISRFETYLIKSITPQILFTILLLTVTSMSFFITYKTLRKQMQLSKIKNEFISNMSHELKTPISTVKVALEALYTFNMIENPEITKEYLEMASHEMNRLDMLVNQALNTSLLEEGKITIHKESLDIQQLLNDTILILQIKIQQYHASVNTVVTGSNFKTHADRLHIQGVLVNLIDNSLKYSGNNPEIIISLTERNNDIEIKVSDNGSGIPQEYINKIFDKFFRVPTNDIHNVKGYGLGLSYAYQIMQQHNGSISVRNNRIDGCTFYLTFLKA